MRMAQFLAHKSKKESILRPTKETEYQRKARVELAKQRYERKKKRIVKTASFWASTVTKGTSKTRFKLARMTSPPPWWTMLVSGVIQLIANAVNTIVGLEWISQMFITGGYSKKVRNIGPAGKPGDVIEVTIFKWGKEIAKEVFEL